MSSLPRRLLDSAAARVICARLVRESPQFFAREIARPPGVHVYRLRENGVRVAIRHRSVDAATLAEVFYHHWYAVPAEVARALGEPEQIIDLGANIGMFGAFAVTRWPGATITGYEPDADNAAVHERTIAENGLGGRWRLVHAAAGASEGEVRLAAGRGPSSFVLEDDPSMDYTSVERVVAVPLLDVLPSLSAAGLVKIDIEGGEWPILGDPRFAADPPPVVVLEYHAGGCPAPNPRTEAERLLAAAGMRTAPIADASRDNYGMLWAWRA